MKGKNLLYALLPAAIVVGVIAYVAYRTRPVLVPKRRWKRFFRPGTKRLDQDVAQGIQGIYSIQSGNDFFGETAVVKWSYTVEKEKQVQYLSLFCEKNGTYIICEGRQYENEILLSGYWRKAAANGTGLVRLVLSDKQNGDNNLVFQGVFGDGDDEPRQPLTLSFVQPLPKKPPLHIIGHRGGARNVDFLPISENSIEMLKLASQLGATGVEIDVRLTKDGIPVIFHDSFLSIHTVKRKVYGGLIHNYTFKELQSIELRKGGYIPTLEECLNVMLYQTPLETVWLDIKRECDLDVVLQLQQEYTERAKALNRRFYIYIGVPDKNILACFTQLNNHNRIPSLTELEPEVALDINAQVWAPQYTKGLQKDNIAKMHEAGKKVFVWSLDSETLINFYMKEGGFDGLVTNTPSVVAHWYYTTPQPKKLSTPKSENPV